MASVMAGFGAAGSWCDGLCAGSVPQKRLTHENAGTERNHEYDQRNPTKDLAF